MAVDLFVPQLGQTVEEVVLISWLVEDGAKVDFGDSVLEVETDKAVFNVEANAKGYVHFGPYQVGETLPVLTVVATIGKKDEGFLPSDQAPQVEALPEGGGDAPAVDLPAVDESKPESPKAQEREKVFASPRAKKMAGAKQVDLSRIHPTGGEGVRVVEQDVIDYLQQKTKVTPIASALAAEVGLDLGQVSGTGPAGAVTRSDVEGAIRDRLSQPVSGFSAVIPDIKYPVIEVAERTPLRGVRKRIFERMTASDQSTVRVTLVAEADATDLVRLREKLKADKSEQWGFTPGYNDLLAKIVAHALSEFPYMNARVSKDGQSIETLAEINLGMAVDTERGLVVPVIRGADTLDLQTFGQRFRKLVEEIQNGQISPENLTGSTFTITNLGNFDVDAFTPVINVPELAILGVGRIFDKVVPYEGEIKVRKMITLSLVFDHRLVDGAPAARFLQRVKEYLEYPVMIFV
ncbi:MAG: 2-oxo acid dehydrogenase subunit E2 [Brevefilum sp.]|nr:2-oxo acid dehydrogenase subunit E2 [Brevefilum sp.]